MRTERNHAIIQVPTLYGVLRIMKKYICFVEHNIKSDSSTNIQGSRNKTLDKCKDKKEYSKKNYEEICSQERLQKIIEDS